MTDWKQEKFGMVLVNHASSQTRNMAELSVPGGKLHIDHSELELFWKLLKDVFAEGKRMRSLEVQRVLNGAIVTETVNGGPVPKDITINLDAGEGAYDRT
jgi:hypothetical protein